MKNSKSSTIGLNKSRRVDWNLPENLALIGFVNNSGLHGKVVAKHCGGMSVGQVYNRCKKLGVRKIAYRYEKYKPG